MVDAHGLEPCGAIHGGSIPLLGTLRIDKKILDLFYFLDDAMNFFQTVLIKIISGQA